MCSGSGRVSTAKPPSNDRRASMRQPWPLMLGLALSLAFAGSAFGQTPPAPDKTVEEKKEAEKKEEEKPKTLWEEHTLFAYVENSYTWNLGKTSKGRVNDFRLYDYDDGYT